MRNYPQQQFLFNGTTNTSHNNNNTPKDQNLSSAPTTTMASCPMNNSISPSSLSSSTAATLQQLLLNSVAQQQQTKNPLRPNMMKNSNSTNIIIEPQPQPQSKQQQQTPPIITETTNTPTTNLNSLQSLNNSNFPYNLNNTQQLLMQQLQQQQRTFLNDIIGQQSSGSSSGGGGVFNPPSYQFLSQQQGYNSIIHSNSNSSDLGFLSTSTSSNSSSNSGNLTPSPTNQSHKYSPPSFLNTTNTNTNNNTTNNTNTNNNTVNTVTVGNNTMSINNMTSSSSNDNIPKTNSSTCSNLISKKNQKSTNSSSNTFTFSPYPVTSVPATTSTMKPNVASSLSECPNSKQLLFIEENGKTKVTSSSLLMQSNSEQFEISCTSCRAKHRKCSKELPACSYCMARGITCVYRKPKKKGRQGKQAVHNYEDSQMDSFLEMGNGLDMNELMPIDPVDNNNEMIFSMMNNNQQNQQQIDNHTTNHPHQYEQAIPSFDPNNWINQMRSSLQTNDNSNDMNMLHSLLTSDSINNIFSLTNLMENNPPFNNNQTIPIVNATHSYSINDLTDELMKRLTLEDYCKSTSFPVIDKSEVSSLLQNEKRTLEATALLYSIHALMFQRKGLRHEAESACQQARNILSKVFDKYNNFLIACAYCNLSVYSSGEGNLSEAKFYLKFVDYYFENDSNNNLTTDTSIIRVNNFNLRMLKTVAEMSAGIAAQDTDSNPLGLQSDSEKKEIGNLLIGFYKLCTGEKKPPQPLLDIVSKTVTGDTLKLYMTLLELVSKLFYQHEMERNLSNEHSEISQRVINSFIHGTRVLILQECGISNGPIIEESANRLINISCEDNYGTAYSVLLCAIAAACRVHLKIVKDIKQGLRMNSADDGVDYFDMIKKGLKALTLFSSRFGRVNKMYRSLLLELQEVERENNGFKLCLLASKEMERLKLKKLTTNISLDVPLLSKEDILSIYYLVSPEQ